jgi:predicted dehydrogenase
MKYNIAMVGTGYMARKHCDALASHPDASLEIIYSTERSKSVAEQFKELYGFTHSVTDYAAVLSDPRIDIIFICSPDYTHPEYVIPALQAGKHVFCEKPLGRTGDHFQLIREQLKASGKVLQVGMNCRFREQYSIPQKRIAAGEFGQLRFLRGTYIYNVVSATRKREKAWALEYPHGIFPFMHGGGIHCLDLLRWIGGNVVSVFARATGFELADELRRDTFSISLAFASGALGELLVSAAAFRPNDFSLEMWLERGSLMATNVFHREGDALALAPEQIIVEQKIIDLGLQFQNMLQAIESGQEPLNSFNEAYANFKALAAIDRSISEGRLIEMADSE